MSSIYFASASVAREGIYSPVLHDWVIKKLIFAARSWCILESFARYGNFLLKWTDDDTKKSDVENTDDERNDEYAAPSKRPRNENADGFGDQWMNDDEWQHENEDNTAGQQEETGDSDNGDGDDNDDNNSDNDDHDEDDEDEEDEEDEEEEEEERVPISIHERLFYSMAASIRNWFNDLRIGMLGGNVSRDPYRFEPFVEEYLSRFAAQSFNRRDAGNVGGSDEVMRDVEEPRDLDLDPYIGVDRNDSVRDLRDFRG